MQAAFESGNCCMKFFQYCSEIYQSGAPSQNHAEYTYEVSELQQRYCKNCSKVW